MPELIKDGTGNGYLAKVNSDHQLHVAAVSVTMEHYVNHTLGQAYNILWPTFTISTGNDKPTLYLKNEGSKSIVLEGFSANVTAEATVYAKFGVTGIPGNGTDMEIGNLNGGSANILDVTAKYGDGLTGLSGGRIFWRSGFAGSPQSGFVNFDADLILPPQQTMLVYANSAGFTSLGFFVAYLVPDGGQI